MIGKEIRNILLNDTDVAAMVSTRVYSDLRPQTDNTVPAIVYRIQDKRREHSQDPAGVDIYRMEFAMYGDTYAQIQELARRVENALDRYPIGTVINNYIIDGVIHEESEDDPYDIDENGLRSKLAEYQCRIKIYNIAMNYSLAEQDTGDTWTDGSAIYEITVDHGASTGSVEMTAVLKGWTVFGYGESFYWDGTNSRLTVNGNAPTATGTTGWVILVSTDSTQAYTKLRYMKQSIAP